MPQALAATAATAAQRQLFADVLARLAQKVADDERTTLTEPLLQRDDLAHGLELADVDDVHRLVDDELLAGA